MQLFDERFFRVRSCDSCVVLFARLVTCRRFAFVQRHSLFALFLLCAFIKKSLARFVRHCVRARWCVGSSDMTGPSLLCQLVSLLAR